MFTWITDVTTDVIDTNLVEDHLHSFMHFPMVMFSSSKITQSPLCMGGTKILLEILD